MTYARVYVEHEPTRADIDALSGDTLLEFGAPWCGHCIAAQAAMEASLSTRGDIVHFKIEDGRGKPLGRSFKIKLWPTLVLLRGGVEIARSVRPVSTEDMERLLSSS